MPEAGITRTDRRSLLAAGASIMCAAVLIGASRTGKAQWTGTDRLAAERDDLGHLMPDYDSVGFVFCGH